MIPAISRPMPSIKYTNSIITPRSSPQGRPSGWLLIFRSVTHVLSSLHSYRTQYPDILYYSISRVHCTTQWLLTHWWYTQLSNQQTWLNFAEREQSLLCPLRDIIIPAVTGPMYYHPIFHTFHRGQSNKSIYAYMHQTRNRSNKQQYFIW